MTPKKKRHKRPGRVDRHRLYQESVQAPESDIEFFTEIYRGHHGKKPLRLREDFCGTALFCREWVESDPRRTALGVDLDEETLAWGRKHNIRGKVADRVKLANRDVREVRRPKSDITCAMNFSFCVLQRRSELLDYFAAVHDGLRAKGMLVLELYGGTEAIVATEERREVEDFIYVWEQESYNPITHATRCHIHFELADGTRIERAFTYDWRLWGIAELREALAEAGFSASEVYWERVDEDGDGTGEYEKTEDEENQEGWLVYVVGLK